jgi:Protein of unknown function (DUF3102)
MSAIAHLRTGDRDAVAIGKLCDRAKASIVDSVMNMIEAGRKMTAKKMDLGHGNWLPWLKDNADALGFSSKHTAARLMRLASKCSASDTFDETEASQISKGIWGHTSKVAKSKKALAKPSEPQMPTKPRGESASAVKYKNARVAIRETIVAGKPYITSEIAEALDVSVDTVERAAHAEQARIDTFDEFSIDPKTLSLSATAKIAIATRRMEGKLNLAHAARMHDVDEDVRLRVVAEGKEYLTMVEGLEAKAKTDEKLWREMINGHKPPFTADQFKTILMCLHPDGVRTADKLADAFRLFNGKKLQLTGMKA